MRIAAVTTKDFGSSVIAVPPLARHADLAVNREANRSLVRHIEAGGVRTLMYGGNANFYHLPLSEYAQTLELLAEIAGAATWVIPSVGPDYGRMIDQALTVKKAGFPTCMVLPQAAPSTPAGVKAGIRRLVDRFGKPVIVYLRAESYLGPKDVAELVTAGVVLGVKYAIERVDPTRDAYLTELLAVVDRRHVISGMGERPAIVHLRDFGLPVFTSGSVCVAPRASMRLLAVVQSRDFAEAERVRAAFMPLEDLRAAVHAIRVLHDAVTLAGIADMGPVLPLLSNLEAAERARVEPVARALLAFDRSVAPVGPEEAVSRAATGE